MGGEQRQAGARDALVHFARRIDDHRGRPVEVLDQQPAARADRGGERGQHPVALGQVLEHQAGVDEIEATDRKARAGEVGLDHLQALGLERREETGVGVQRGDAAGRADTFGECGGEASGPRAGIEALPARGEPEPLAQPQRARIKEGSEAVEPVALRVPGWVQESPAGRMPVDCIPLCTALRRGVTRAARGRARRAERRRRRRARAVREERRGRGRGAVACRR